MDLKKYIHAGELFVSDEPIEIATVLGSCVSVCLYDPTTRVGGMNHYLLPLWNANGLKSPKFGNISIPLLIDHMLEKGAKKIHLQAKLFGGANLSSQSLESLMIGKKNIMIAHDILEEYRIPVVAEDLGGTRGRRLLMESGTGKVFMKYTQEGCIR